MTHLLPQPGMFASWKDWASQLLNALHADSGEEGGSGGVAAPAGAVAIGELAAFADTSGAQLASSGLLPTAFGGSLLGLTDADALRLLGGVSTEPLVNGKLVASVAANALTIAVKTWAGGNPSAADPVWVIFRRSDGTSVLRKLVAPLSLTVIAGDTQGAVNGVPFRLWVSMLDTAGTLSLFTTNASPANAQVVVNDHIHPAIVSRILGYMDWNSGLPTAGQWVAGPNVIQAFGPGIRMPGEIVQSASAAQTGGAAFTTTLITPQAIPGLSVTLTPTSPVNKFNCAMIGGFAVATGPGPTINIPAVSIRRGGAVVGYEHLVAFVNVATVSLGESCTIVGTDAPGVASALTWIGTIRSTVSGQQSVSNLGTILSVSEVMG